MSPLVSQGQPIRRAVWSPGAGYSRVFGLACKADAGIGADDFAYSPKIGNRFWLRFMSLWYGGGEADNCAGTIYITSGEGVPPNGEVVALRWDMVIPFWSGTTKPAIMLQGREGYIWWPMNRLYEGKELRFGLAIENGSATLPWWVNVWFEVSEG